MRTVLCLLCLVGGACLASRMPAGPDVEMGPGGDPLTRLVGSAKEAVGDTLFLKADEYFHGGVEDEEHHDENVRDIKREGLLENKEQREPSDWIDRINRQVHAHELRYLTSGRRKEMLPFFAWGTSLDPHNVEAILTSAYWLDSEFGKTAEAADLLERGIRDNVDSWELEQALAKIYGRDKATWDRAYTHYRAALQKSSDKKLENFERLQLSHDQIEIDRINGYTASNAD